MHTWYIITLISLMLSHTVYTAPLSQKEPDSTQQRFKDNQKRLYNLKNYLFSEEGKVARIVIAGVSFVAFGGSIGYLLWRTKKKPGKKTSNQETDEKDVEMKDLAQKPDAPEKYLEKQLKEKFKVASCRIKNKNNILSIVVPENSAISLATLQGSEQEIKEMMNKYDQNIEDIGLYIAGNERINIWHVGSRGSILTKKHSL